MTEEEAKKKWCPHAQMSRNNCCVASGCMMWRLVEQSPVDAYDEIKPMGGYCGLAGKAQ